MLVGDSAVMVALRARVARIGRSGFAVLIEGESGAGKELVARDIHNHSARSRGPFVAVNCAALVESLLEAELFGIEERTATGVRGRRGRFELADGGTLFLDEVGDLSPMAQAKLLRVLQDMTIERVGSHVARTFDTRVVAATNRGLQEMVAADRFRADLYYRLSGVEIVVPSLRCRRSDIPQLVAHFLKFYGRAGSLTVSTSALAALVAYDWPGNVRQLARVLERAIALANGSEILLGDLPESISCVRGETPVDLGPGDGGSLRVWSSYYVRSVLDRCLGNKKRACDILDISYHTLQSHLSYASVGNDGGAPAEPVSTRDGPQATCDAAV